jgi:flagellar motility protein MotE (MotC chaperone)
MPYYISGDIETHMDLVNIIDMALKQRERIIDSARVDLEYRLNKIRKELDNDEIDIDEIKRHLDWLESEIKPALSTSWS